MGWVVKKPKRSDFCGSPPCPLCFDWQTERPAGRVQDAWVQEIISGFSKFTEDMIGPKAPTANETQVLTQAAEAIHVANLSFGERVDAEFKAADKAQHTERQMNDFLAKKRADAARPPVVVAKPLLDDMDLSKLNEPPPKPATRTGFVAAFDPTTIATIFGRGASSFFYIDDLAKGMERDIAKVMGMDLAPPPLDDKETRRIQAEADAKKRMKLAARTPSKVGR